MQALLCPSELHEWRFHTGREMVIRALFSHPAMGLLHQNV